MKPLKYAGIVLIIIAAIFAANTSLTLEGCQSSNHNKDYVTGQDNLYPDGRYNIKKTVSDGTQEATDKIKDTSENLAENGKNIADGTIKGTTSVAKDAKDTYVGLLDYLIGDIRQSWINLIASLGGNTDAFYEENSGGNTENNLVIDVDEYNNRNKQKAKEAWESSNHFDKSSTNSAKYSEQTRKLPYSSKDVKKNCTSCQIEKATLVLDGSTVEIPPYLGESLAITLNGNNPYFNTGNLSTDTYERYSELDDLGRAGVAEACLGPETIDNTERGSLGMYKPSGYVQKKYPGMIDSNPPYIYNRCHLLMRKIGGNDSELNLITGTYRFNHEEGMLQFEKIIMEYIYATGNHCHIRVTPVYKDNNLLANGVIYEAASIEDDSIRICSFIFNAESDDIVIDYTTGNNWISNE